MGDRFREAGLQRFEERQRLGHELHECRANRTFGALITKVTEMMPAFEGDFVAYEDMKAYLIDEDADLQETNQDLELIELIGVQNWLVQKLTGTGTAAAE